MVVKAAAEVEAVEKRLFDDTTLAPEERKQTAGRRVTGTAICGELFR